MKILGIAGSLRQGSYNRALLRAAQELASVDAQITPYTGLGDIPPYNEDVRAQGDPPPVKSLKAQIQAADALLIATPEYNYGIPGVLKNAIDWASRPPEASPLRLKPIALMGASPGNMGTVRAQLALRQTFLFTESYVLLKPEVLVWRAADRFDAQGNLTDRATREHVSKLITALVAWTRQLNQQRIALPST